jgi:cytidylate kinase
LVVAIDGPAGVGKSTIAACVARRTRFLYINSGSFYRCITKQVLDTATDPENKAAIVRSAADCRFDMRDGGLYLNGRLVGEDIHTDAVDRYVASHSSIPEVREIVNRNLRRIAADLNIVMEGRDISTVVFPGAEVKIFLDAPLGVRTRRRLQQGFSALTEEELKRSLSARDTVDKNKPTGRLEMARDAQYIDTTDLTIEQVCDRVITEIHKKVQSTRRHQ